MSNKRRLLAWLDSPTAFTGFGRVARYILRALYSTGNYDISVLGINYFGDFFNKNEFPYQIVPAKLLEPNDPYGNLMLLRSLRHDEEYDFLFVLNDAFVTHSAAKRVREVLDNKQAKTKIVYYYPVDCSVQTHLSDLVRLADVPITYTEFGKEKTLTAYPLLASKLQILPHGTDTVVFRSISAEERWMYRKQYFNIDSDSTCLIINVNRNSIRKDLAKTILAFSEFRRKYPDSKLYLHTNIRDQQIDLSPALEELGLNDTTDVIFPKNYSPARGYPDEVMNRLYNCADFSMSTARGEGWGLCLHPATPVLTKGGYKPISEINVGEKVQTSNGWSQVQDVYKREVKGESIVKIVPLHMSAADPLMVTEDHPILTKRGYIKAGKLLENDELAIYVNRFIYRGKPTQKLDLINYLPDKKYCRTEHAIWLYGARKVSKIKRFVSVNKDFAMLYGIYLAEGSASKGGIVFSIGKHEKRLTRLIVRLVKRVWGKHCAIEDGAESGKRWIRVYSDILRRVYASLAGSGARNKNVDPEIFADLSKHTATKLLVGYWLGDGSLEKRSFEMTTTSKWLAYQLRELAVRLGMLWTIEYNKKRRSYRLRSRLGNRLQFACMVDRNPYQFGLHGSPSISKISHGLCFVPIKHLQTSSYSGLVFDIQVADVHNFQTSHAIVHNSISESLAAGVPVVAPAYTSPVEILADGRGILYPCQELEYIDNSGYRKSGHLDSIVKAMLKAKEMPADERAAMVEKARIWVEERSWDNVGHQWIKLFDRVYSAAQDKQKTLNTTPGAILAGEVI